MTPKKILFATDLSCRCDRALDRAAAFAAEWKAQLIVLHVLQDSDPVTDLPSWRRSVDPLQAARQRVQSDLHGAEGVDLEVIVERGDPASVILDTVERLGCELILTGVARDETLGRVLLGGTTQTLARKAKVPLLIVKSRLRGPYRNVVVATDFSEGSRRALAAALVLLPSAEVSLFHAYDVAHEGFVDDKMTARQSVSELAQQECRTFLAHTTEVAASGRSVASICEYGEVGSLLRDLAQARRVDLVALGTRGRGGLVGALLGSVAERLLHELQIDILLVRRRKDEK